MPSWIANMVWIVVGNLLRFVENRKKVDGDFDDVRPPHELKYHKTKTVVWERKQT